MMEQAAIVPRLAFVINLSRADQTGSTLARTKHLVHSFHCHRLPATWAVADAMQARLVLDSAAVTQQIGLAWDAKLSGPRCGEQLAHRLALLSSVSGPTSLLVGDYGAFSSRLSILADLGIRAIFTNSAPEAAPLKPRPLPCGMWLVAPRVHLPKRRRLSWLPTRQATLKELLASACDGITLVSITASQWEQAGARAMQALERLLRDISWSSSRGEVQVATVADVVSELTARHTVKPQRSILRLAA
jgi:hypothetical protein